MKYTLHLSVLVYDLTQDFLTYVFRNSGSTCTSMENILVMACSLAYGCIYTFTQAASRKEENVQETTKNLDTQKQAGYEARVHCHIIAICSA